MFASEPAPAATSEGGRPPRGGRRAGARGRSRPGGPERRRGASRGRQLRRRPHPAWALPADARAAVRPRQRGCGRARRPPRRRVHSARRAAATPNATAVDPAWVVPAARTSASFAAGAGFLLTYLTAYIPLHRQVRVTRCVDRCSCTPARAESGRAAIQLAKDLGARVIATASSDEKRAFAVAAGADEAVGYDEIDDLRVDVVIDPVGGDDFKRSLPLLKPLGQIVAIGFTSGLWEDPSVDVARRPKRRRPGRLPRAADQARAGARARLRHRAARALGGRADRPAGRLDASRSRRPPRRTR